jgi:DNA-directed RNA polymerase subunit RPC12/RpoP
MESITQLAEENNCSKVEYAFKYFKEQGCQLLENYVGAMIPMEYICKCGRKAKTSWNNFTKGKRCGYCHKTGRKKKWTIEELKSFYLSHGCELLSDDYINNKKPIKFKCKCGKEYEKLFNEFKKQPRCWDCYIESRSGKNHHAWVDGRSLKRKTINSKPKIKITNSYVSEYFKEQGCVLLSEYTGSSKPLRYICRCGKESTTIWDNFKQGKRCGRCGSRRTVKFTLEEIKQIFKDAGCEFLDDAYVNNTTPYKFRCSCGNEETIKIQYFRQGVRCSQCKKAKRSGENHFAWRHDREMMELDIKFRKRVYGFLARCREKFGTPKEDHSDKVLGYTPKQLQDYIMKHPNWDSVKDKNWNLDHIFPIEAFLEHGITDFRLINSLDNLQPITQTENNQKKDKYDVKEFFDWLVSHS